MPRRKKASHQPIFSEGMRLLIYYFLDFDLLVSSCNAFKSEMTIISMMKENGKAAMIMVFCKADKPFTDNKIKAIVD